MTVTEGGKPRRVEVPVEMPEGMSYEGVWTEQVRQAMAMNAPAGAPVGGFVGVTGGIPKMRTPRVPRSRRLLLPRPFRNSMPHSQRWSIISRAG